MNGSGRFATSPFVILHIPQTRDLNLQAFFHSSRHSSPTYLEDIESGQQGRFLTVTYVRRVVIWVTVQSQGSGKSCKDLLVDNSKLTGIFCRIHRSRWRRRLVGLGHGHSHL